MSRHSFLPPKSPEEVLMQETILRIEKRCNTDAQLKAIESRQKVLVKKLNALAQSRLMRAEKIAQEEWTKTLQKMRHR